MADKLKGKDFLLFMERSGQMVPVCCSREMEISISADTIEATKAPQSKWKSYFYGDLSYTVTCSGLTVLEGFTVNDFFSAINNRLSIAFIARNDAVPGLFFSGNIIITNMPISAPYKDLITFSISAIGDGPLSNSNPYEFEIMTDEDGNIMYDDDGEILYSQDSGDLLPIDLNTNC